MILNKKKIHDIYCIDICPPINVLNNDPGLFKL